MAAETDGEAAEEDADEYDGQGYPDAEEEAWGCATTCDDGHACTVDSCDPSAHICLHDAAVVAGVTCRAAAGPCDMAETCDGVGEDCPTDGFIAAATVCRASAGDCDSEETCTGDSAACPPDAGVPGDLHEPNNDCASARGPFTVLEGEGVGSLNATLYSPDGAEDQDWFIIHAEEVTDSSCGWPWEMLPQCYFYMTTTLTPPAGASHADWQFCVQDRRTNGCSGDPDFEICTSASDNWDDTAGHYSLTSSWKGTCWLDDVWDFYVVVRKSGAAAVNDCHEYQLSNELAYSDETCPLKSTPTLPLAKFHLTSPSAHSRIALRSRAEISVSHRGRRCAPSARREEGAYSTEYVTDEQRSGRRCSGVRM